MVFREADDVLHRMMDDSTGEQSKSLVGHSGPVYGLSINPDRSLILSCSEDGTVRLWSLLTWTCLVCYKGHMFPVWDCTFAPNGYYFATCGHDRTARLWATDQSQALRIFHGHFSDVDCLAFHPNCNYVGTGSSDRSLRLWDCVTGNCVRLMTGHKSTVLVISFSPDGRFIASGSSDRRVLVWDIAYGHLLAELSHHNSIISSLAFSREGTVLVSSAIGKSRLSCSFFSRSSLFRLNNRSVGLCQADERGCPGGRECDPQSRRDERLREDDARELQVQEYSRPPPPLHKTESPSDLRSFRRMKDQS